MGIDWTLAGSVIFTGITVVFVVLVLLWGVVELMGALLSRISPPVQCPDTTTATAAADISDEEIAAITAAISVVEGNNKFTITEIKPIDKN